MIYLIFAGLLSAQIHWEWQNPLPQGGDLRSIVNVPDSDKIITIGSEGVILSSDNYFTNWDMQHHGEELFAISFPSDQVGFIFGNNGTLLKSKNAGKTWIPQDINDNIDFYSSFFINESLGYAVGVKYEDDDYNGIIIKTTDSGLNWEQTQVPDILLSIHFVDEKMGFVGGTGSHIYKTTDGGNQWTNISIASSPYLFIVSLYFVTSDVGFAIVHNVGVDCRCSDIIRTQDGGETWDRINEDSIIAYLYSLKFYDTMNGLIVGDDGTLLATTDGGNTWECSNCQCINHIYDFCYMNENTIVSAGQGGKITCATDGGLMWDGLSQGTNARLTDVFFINTQTGFVVGENGTLLRTTNAGEKWDDCDTRLSSDLNAIFLLNENVAYAAGDLKKVIKTTDGGNTWNHIYEESRGNFYTIYFIDELTGFAGCYSNFYRTTDGGYTWNKISLNMAPRDIAFMNHNVGIAVGKGGRIVKTVDSGETWSVVNGNVGVTLNSVDFINESVGFIAGDGGVVLKTADGGKSWEHLYTHVGAREWLNSVCLTTEYVGYALGFHKIHYTSDSGNTWESSDEITDNRLYSFDFVDEKTGYAVGSMGTILKIYSNTTGVAERHSDLPNGIRLFQNYPNPFNHSTTIRFDVNESTLAMLDIYNVKGDFIIRLLNAVVPAGQHSVRWDGTDEDGHCISSGIYLYKLRTGEEVITNRMLLIR